MHTGFVSHPQSRYRPTYRSSQPSPSASKIATPPPIVSGKNLTLVFDAAWRNVTPDDPATSVNVTRDVGSLSMLAAITNAHTAIRRRTAYLRALLTSALS